MECVADEDQRYALYLPKDYDPKVGAPVLYGFSPGGDGRDVVVRHAQAAEKFGWIVVGSYNSRNGPADVSQFAARAMIADVQERFAVRPDRQYTSGMSGGSVVAAWVAGNGEVPIAGAYLHARGPASVLKGAKGSSYYYLLPGDRDFNLGESFRFLCLARKQGANAQIDVQQGGHGWANAERIEAMLRFAEVRHSLASEEDLDWERLAWITEELAVLEGELLGPFAWLAFERLGEWQDAMQPHAKESTKLRKLLRSLEKIRENFEERALLEKPAWDKFVLGGQIDLAKEDRYPSADSLRKLDSNLRDLIVQHHGTTGAHVAILTLLNAPASLTRILEQLNSESDKNAYREFIAGATKIDWDPLEAAQVLLKAKEPGRAIVCLYHASYLDPAGTKKATLSGNTFRKLKRLPAFERFRTFQQGKTSRSR